jgi:putative hemolysin/predicted secreted protein
LGVVKTVWVLHSPVAAKALEARVEVYNKLVSLVISVTMIFVLAACGKPQPETVIEPPVEGPADVPNPIAVYCTELGYEYTTRERKIDAPQPQPEPSAEPTPEPQPGTPVVPGMPAIPDYILEVVCVFPDGTECEESEFMSGRCGQEYSYCVQQGYTLEPGVSMATCVFPDGSSCLEIELFNGDCGPVPVEPVEPPAANGPRPVVHSIELREGETYTIALETDPSSGNEWEAEFSGVFLELVERTSDDATGEEVFTFRARAGGVTEAYFSYSRRHEVICNFTIGADPALAEAMSEAEAREIATNSECGEAGALLENAFYNDWTATWWIDLDVEQEGCMPACVVNVRMRQAEINWRCTGVLPPEGTE